MIASTIGLIRPKNELQDRSLDMIQLEESKEIRIKKNEKSIYELWNMTKRNDIHIIGAPKEKRRRKTHKTYLKI